MYILDGQALSSAEALSELLKHIKRAVDNAKRALFPLSIPPPAPRGLIFPLPTLPTTQKESQATTSLKKSLKKWICAASKFMALIPSRVIRQTLAIFLELNSKGLYQSSGKEQESYCLVFPPSSTKREIWHLQVVVVQRWLRNVQKAWRHVQSCCFANPIKPIAFLPFSVPSPSSSLKLPRGAFAEEREPCAKLLTILTLTTNADVALQEESFLDALPTDECLKKVRIIVVNVPCSKSGVVNPVDFVLQEGVTNSIKELARGNVDSSKVSCAVWLFTLTQ